MQPRIRGMKPNKWLRPAGEWQEVSATDMWAISVRVPSHQHSVSVLVVFTNAQNKELRTSVSLSSPSPSHLANRRRRHRRREVTARADPPSPLSSSQEAAWYVGDLTNPRDSALFPCSRTQISGLPLAIYSHDLLNSARIRIRVL